MKTNVKKQMLLTAVVFAVLLSGCSGKNSNAKKSGAQTGSKTMMTALGYGEPLCGEWDEYPVFHEIEEQCNVDVKWTTISGEGATEKLGLILASKELPDMLFSGLDTIKIVTYASKGIIRPMEDLIDGGYAPNFKKILEENPEIRKAITMPDGHIYVLPAINSNPDPVMTTTLNINKQWCDALGVDPASIQTIDDFSRLMKRFVEEDPNGNGKKDEKGFTFEPVPPYHVWNGDADFSGAWGIMTDWAPIMIKDDKIACTPVLEEYKGYIKWFADMYKKGLIDKEVFTQDHNQYISKIDGGNVGAYLTNGPILSAKVEYVSILPLEGPGGKKWGAQDFSIDKGRGLITTACKTPEIAMKFMDSFYEPLTSLKLQYGIYLKDLGNGKFEVLPNESGKSSQAPGAYVAKNLSRKVVDTFLIKTPEMMKEEERQKLYAPYLLKPLPLMNFTPEEASELATLSTDISKIIDEQKAKWCTGQGNIDTEWNGYVKSLNNVGLTRFMEIYNIAYGRYQASAK